MNRRLSKEDRAVVKREICRANRIGMDALYLHFGSVRAMARQLDVSDFTVAKWIERGQISKGSVRLACKVTGLNLWDIRLDIYIKENEC